MAQQQIDTAQGAQRSDIAELAGMVTGLPARGARICYIRLHSGRRRRFKRNPRRNWESPDPAVLIPERHWRLVAISLQFAFAKTLSNSQLGVGSRSFTLLRIAASERHYGSLQLPSEML